MRRQKLKIILSYPCCCRMEEKLSLKEVNWLSEVAQPGSTRGRMGP